MAFDLAEEFLSRAKKCLEQAEESISPKYHMPDYPLGISRSHECVEFALKSALLTIDTQYSHTHDVSDDLVNALSKFPEWFREKIPCFAVRSKIMSIIRTYAIYGYEVTKTPAKQLFGEYDGRMCIENAKEITSNCERLFYEARYSSK